MIAELVKKSISRIRRDQKDREPEDALPRTCYGRSRQGQPIAIVRKRTFSMNPQQGTRQMPFLKDGTFEKPRCCLLVEVT